MTYITANGHTRINTHWSPYYKICRPCEISYNLIIKFDTFDDDMTYMFKDILKTNYSLDVLLNKNNGPHAAHGAGTKTMDEYYQEVNSLSLRYLRELLSYDCALFGYDSLRRFL